MGGKVVSGVCFVAGHSVWIVVSVLSGVFYFSVSLVLLFF